MHFLIESSPEPILQMIKLRHRGERTLFTAILLGRSENLNLDLIPEPVFSTVTLHLKSGACPMEILRMNSDGPGFSLALLLMVLCDFGQDT